MSTDQFCRGDNGACDCETFQAQEGNSARCAECNHGRSKHPGPEAAIVPSQVIVPPVASGSSTSKVVHDIFRNITAGKLSSNAPAASQVAREEALTTKKRSEYAKLVKAPAESRKPRSGSQMLRGSSGSIFHVSSIGIMVCGIDKHGHIRDDDAPSGRSAAVQIQNMKNRGCYKDGDVAIDSSWTYIQITAKLREWFPKVFAFIEEKEQQRGIPGQSPQWRLLDCRSGKFSIVDIGEPTGLHLSSYKGRSKAGIADSHLWFVTRSRVPLDIYESWNTEPIIIGSDSEEEEEEHRPVLGSDSDDGGIDNTLSGPMTELKLNQKAKRSHEVFSSPESGRVAPKRLKDSHPLPSINDVFTTPDLSSAPMIIEVREDDQLLRNVIPQGERHAIPIINPWNEDYQFVPSLRTRSLDHFFDHYLF